jgi:hypothetical protein
MHPCQHTLFEIKVIHACLNTAVATTASLGRQPDHFLHVKMTRIQETGCSVVVNHAQSDRAIVTRVEAYELEIATSYGTQYQLP